MIIKTTTVAATAALALAATAHGQTLVNGSLTDTAAVSTPPAGWFAWSDTADTADAAGPFNNTGTPWTLSPDGGTFVRMGRGASTMEGIGQVVSGFTIGQVYQVDFFATNLGFENAVTAAWTGSDGYVEFFVDGVFEGSSSLLSKPTLSTDPTVWSAHTVTFIATDTTLELAFAADRPGSAVEAAYMGVDGIRLSRVPTPGAFGVLGVASLVAGRRRR